MNIKRILFALVASIIPFGLFWLSGVEFERGIPLVYMAIISLWAGSFVYTCMDWKG